MYRGLGFLFVHSIWLLFWCKNLSYGIVIKCTFFYTLWKVFGTRIIIIQAKALEMVEKYYINTNILQHFWCMYIFCFISVCQPLPHFYIFCRVKKQTNARDFFASNFDVCVCVRGYALQFRGVGDLLIFNQSCVN